MRPRTIAALTGAAAVTCALAVTAPAQAQPSSGAPSANGASHRSDNRPGPKSAEQARLRAKALTMLQNGKATLKPQPGGGATVTLSTGDVVEFPLEKTDQVFTILSEFGDAGSGKLGTTPGAAAQRRSRSPTAPRTTPPTGSPTSTRPTTRTCSTAPATSFKDFYPKQSGGRYTADEHRDRLGHRCPATPRRTATTPSRTSAARGPSSATPPTPGTTPRRRAGKTAADIEAYLAAVRRVGPLRLRRRRQLQRARRLHRPLPGRARRRGRGGRRRRGRHLVAPLVRQPDYGTTGPTGRRQAQPARRRPDRRHRRTGSATTPSSPRTAASASSPTSSATTSACRTTTTPPAARTAPASGP